MKVYEVYCAERSRRMGEEQGYLGTFRSQKDALHYVTNSPIVGTEGFTILVKEVEDRQLKPTTTKEEFITVLDKLKRRLG